MVASVVMHSVPTPLNTEPSAVVTRVRPERPAARRSSPDNRCRWGYFSSRRGLVSKDDLLYARPTPSGAFGDFARVQVHRREPRPGLLSHRLGVASMGSASHVGCVDLLAIAR